MVALRWTMGLLLAAIGGGFFAFTVFARGFRRSLGASPFNPLLQILPLAAMAVMLLGLIWPTNRAVLHAGALAAIGTIGFCVWQAVSEGALVVWFGVLYAGVWLWMYWKLVH
jgi:hypothetical protein